MSNFLPVLLLLNLSAIDTLSVDWAAVPASCLPGIDSVDWRVEVSGDAGAIIWWCEDEQVGLLENSRVSQRGAKAVQKLLLDPRDAAMIIDSAPFRLRPTDTEANLIAALRLKYTPQCTATDVHATNSEGSAVGDLRLGQRVSCGGLKTLHGGHYCNVLGAPCLDGTLLPSDSWIQCDVVRAPEEGWTL